MNHELTLKVFEALEGLQEVWQLSEERLARLEFANLALKTCNARLLVCVANASGPPGGAAARLDFLVTQLRGLIEGAAAQQPEYNSNVTAGALQAMEDTITIAESILRSMQPRRLFPRPEDQSLN